MASNNEKPLWIPLKTEYFLAFEQGHKKEEYRPLGGRWNENTCRVGRRVMLGLGYSGRRIFGTVTSFSIERDVDSLDGWRDVYGDNGGPAAAIGIEIDA